jgi:hypothetical protein
MSHQIRTKDAAPALMNNFISHQIGRMGIIVKINFTQLPLSSDEVLDDDFPDELELLFDVEVLGSSL